MLIGYIRERKKGPPIEEQIAALRNAGLAIGGRRRTLYEDRIDRDTKDTLPERQAAVERLKPGDSLVVFDEATLGTTEIDLLRVLADIGQREATLHVANGRTYRCTPAIAELAALVAEGGKILAREKIRLRSESSPNLGRPKLLKGATLLLARELWGRRDMTGKQIADEIRMRTGVEVGTRTLLTSLGEKTAAVLNAERELRRPRPAPLETRAKPKRIRRTRKFATAKEPANAE